MIKCMYSCLEGEEGRKTLEHMNEHHAPLSDWALGFLDCVDPGDILDIGCGGGMLIRKLHERYPLARIHGIDISEESVKASLAHNPGIEGLDVRVASVSDIPYADGMFQIVTAVETYFFWPDLPSDLVSAARCIRTGGTILVVSEMYPHPDFDEANSKYIEAYGMNIIGNDEMLSLLDAAGFDAECRTLEEKNWVAFIGKKR